MSDKRPLTRRQFVQRSAVTTAGLLLTACASDATTNSATPTQALAQQQATATTPPTGTALPPTVVPASTTVRAPATELPTATTLPAAEPTATIEPPAPAEPTATTEPSATTAPTTAPTATLEPTIACDDDDDEETIAQTEGPYYTPNTPERTSFLADGPGTRIVVAGRVLGTNCTPIAAALIDFWHADDSGEYDNATYRFRGHQFTDAAGNYRLETVVPGLYPGRTRHFHVKVQGPNMPVLTTQLYFPDEPGNARDGIFHPSLVLATTSAADGLAAAFDFVLA